MFQMHFEYAALKITVALKTCRPNAVAHPAISWEELLR
jgi:hypothetical protein